MTNQLITFNFHNDQVRTATHDNGEIYFCLTDVAKILDIDRTSNLLQTEKDVVNDNTLRKRGVLDPKGVQKLDTLTKGGNQEVTFINEPNLYRVIFRSNKTEAKQFQDWVFNDVLPTLRKTGQYTTPSQPTAPKKDYSDSDLQHLKEVFKIPEIATLLGTTEPQAIQRLYQSYPQQTAQSQQLALPHIYPRHQALLDKFWHIISQLDLDQINHAKDPQVLAINLPQLYQIVGDQLPPKRTMLQALKHSLIPKFLQSNQSIRSDITHDTKKCWVFLQE